MAQGKAPGSTSLTYIKVHSSEVRSLNAPNFTPIKITGSKLCSGQYSLPIKIQLMNHSFNGNHSYKSHVFLTVNDFVQKNVRSWKFLGSSKQSAVSGELALSSFQKEINYSFIDYLRGGIDINLITCIDFTGSNGIPSHPGSLHYMAPSIDA